MAGERHLQARTSTLIAHQAPVSVKANRELFLAVMPQHDQGLLHKGQHARLVTGVGKQPFDQRSLQLHTHVACGKGDRLAQRRAARRRDLQPVVANLRPERRRHQVRIEVGARGNDKIAPLCRRQPQQGLLETPALLACGGREQFLVLVHHQQQPLLRLKVRRALACSVQYGGGQTGRLCQRIKRHRAGAQRVHAPRPGIKPVGSRQRRQNAGRQQRRLAAARRSDDGEEGVAAQAVHSLGGFRLTPVKALLLDRGEWPHAGIRAGRLDEDDADPFLMQCEQAGVGGVLAQRSRQQSMQPHAFVTQRPQHQVMADFAPVASVHRDDAVEPEAQVAFQPRRRQTIEFVEGEGPFERGSKAPDYIAAEKMALWHSGEWYGAGRGWRMLGGCHRLLHAHLHSPALDPPLRDAAAQVGGVKALLQQVVCHPKRARAVGAEDDDLLRARQFSQAVRHFVHRDVQSPCNAHLLPLIPLAHVEQERRLRARQSRLHLCRGQLGERRQVVRFCRLDARRCRPAVWSWLHKCFFDRLPEVHSVHPVNLVSYVGQVARPTFGLRWLSIL